MSHFLCHDSAHEAAVALANLVSPCLKSERERREFLGEAYDIVSATIKSYTERLRLEDRRLIPVPSKN
jgi:hypothetical protein